MIVPPFPENENERMQTLHHYQVLDTAEEQAYNELVELAATICGTPVSAVTFVDENRQWFKARKGLTVKETSREVSFCGHAILSGDLFEVPDAREDVRFYDNPLVQGEPHIRFYAGVPLDMGNGSKLGTLCVMDSNANKLSEEQKESLRVLARQIVKQLELDLKERQLKDRTKELQSVFEISRIQEKVQLSMPEMLQEIVSIVPKAFQFPEQTHACIKLYEYVLKSADFKTSPNRLISSIEIDEYTQGTIEVYVEGKSGKKSVAFLPEERGLLEVISRQVKNLAIRKAYEEEVLSLTEEREQRVKERANQLLESNKKLQMAVKELESFSYSVSHDLRAPLRAIIGYSKILENDFSDNLREEGLEVINHIIRNTSKMGVLIDDLLAFSRLGRKEKVVQEFSMNHLVEDVVNELKMVNRNRNIVFNIEKLPNAIGDPSLIRQVVANILSNAVKFTATKEQAFINVSSFIQEGEVVYKIEDNGVGFKMRYAEKIFEVFQRLHSEAEFPGTGIGMALAWKIVRRHGGNIWAEGELNKGASFFFKLAKNQVDLYEDN